MTEEALEDAYVQFLNRKGQRDAATRRRARLAAAPKRGDPNAGEHGGGVSDDSGSDTQDPQAPQFDPPDEVETEVTCALRSSFFTLSHWSCRHSCILHREEERLFRDNIVPGVGVLKLNSGTKSRGFACRFAPAMSCKNDAPVPLNHIR